MLLTKIMPKVRICVYYSVKYSSWPSSKRSAHAADCHLYRSPQTTPLPKALASSMEFTSMVSHWLYLVSNITPPFLFVFAVQSVTCTFILFVDCNYTIILWGKLADFILPEAFIIERLIALLLGLVERQARNIANGVNSVPSHTITANAGVLLSLVGDFNIVGDFEFEVTESFLFRDLNPIL